MYIHSKNLKYPKEILYPKHFLILSGRIPILLDHNQSTPFPVMETSAELLYLLKFYDPNDEFGFTEELERSEALQWLFFWHGSGAPYFGQLGHFARFAKEKIPCMAFLLPLSLKFFSFFVFFFGLPFFLALDLQAN